MAREKDETWVFAYGSNMHLGDLRRWLRAKGYDPYGIRSALAAYLPNYELAWNYHSVVRNGAAANVRQSSGARLFGVALSIAPVLLEAIDVKEGHPHRYHRDEPRLATLLSTGRQVSTWIYEVWPEFVASSLVRPRRAYKQLMIDGARAHGLPDEHVRSIEEVPVLEEREGA